MIYLYPENYEIPEQELIKETSAFDCNDYGWDLSAVKEGVFIHYDGDVYFKENAFTVTDTTNDSSKKYMLIKNTNCIFYKGATLQKARNLIVKNYTDEIWHEINKLLEKRLENNPELLESEIDLKKEPKS